jgi:hypothetical protein
MFRFNKKKSGNRYTLISIILILIAVYVFRLISPQREISYSEIIQYDNARYVYVETVKSYPFMFIRKRPVSQEGYIILSRRGISYEEEVYIYTGYMKYRRYEVLKE